MSRYNMVLMILNRNYEKDYVAFLKQNGIAHMTEMLGHGTASKSILDYLGIENNEKAYCKQKNKEPSKYEGCSAFEAFNSGGIINSVVDLHNAIDHKQIVFKFICTRGAFIRNNEGIRKRIIPALLNGVEEHRVIGIGLLH